MTERRAITVQGIVQGVGFRPFVHGLATRHCLSGFVRNDTGGVTIEIEGRAEAIEQFFKELTHRSPPLAVVDRVDWQSIPAVGGTRFEITQSAATASKEIFISPDAATCPDCIRELFDPNDRRYRYPFLNCTNCGPRLTIIRGAPYDRACTTMASFAMCDDCAREYHDPANRRFHAQPTACPACGPHLRLVNPKGQELSDVDVVQELVRCLRAGQIAAAKGLGGFHLVCDACNDQAVQRLRQRKHREEKPFAVMVADVEMAADICVIDDADRQLLQSPRSPIVLLRKRLHLQSELQAIGKMPAETVAPANPWLGVMLPYTPLHHVLMRDFQDAGGGPLVMTSGNRSDEPIAIDDADALARLGGIADVFVVHNRPIHVRCDDSVARIVDGEPALIRRSRGYAPQPLLLPCECAQPILAVGGQLKGTFALGRGRHAFVSHHMGDLDYFEAFCAFQRDADLYENLFSIRPKIIVHDLHPDYASTRYAQQRAAEQGCDLIVVQHHHAHMASCMAEHSLPGPVIGVCLDGAGLGTDGAIWGGEFLTGGYRTFARAAHLRPIALPGGDKAVREPWRVAAAHLLDAGIDPALLLGRIPKQSLRAACTMIDRRVNSPLTTSAGRLFDAVAALCGVRDRVTYEGQAAIELEWLADRSCVADRYDFEIVSASGQPLVVDTRPIIRGVVADVKCGRDSSSIARAFHTTMVEIVAEVCGRLSQSSSIGAVTLSGGVFMNALLLHGVTQRLKQEGLKVHRHRKVPSNDGGLCLGQLAVAASQFQQDVEKGRT